MSVLFNPFAKFRRSRSETQSFKDDESGIVTVQMVMFSVMLFGGVGLMMDFGRAYSAHSQMQGYIDQVALAAAQQLDGKSDSIQRATAAANAVSKNSSFITGDGTFKISKLTFMVNAPTDANGDYSPSLASTHNTVVPELAKFVRAQASSTSVAVKLLRFASNGEGITDIGISASAVATSRKVSCGGLSPMVMCNPFENESSTSWQEEMKDSIGYRMKVTAIGSTDTNGIPVAGPKPSNYSASSGSFSQIRLGLLQSPADLMNVRNTICTNSSNLPGTSADGSEEMRRDICLLASIDAGLSCVNDQVVYKSAHPQAITTGLDVIFDMYEDSMAEIMDEPEDFDFTHSFPASLGWSSEIKRSSLFYPDTVTGHGRMARADYDIYLDNLEYAINNTPPPSPPPGATPQQAMQMNMIFNFQQNGRRQHLANLRAAYGTPAANDIPLYSRQNHPFATGKRTEWGPAQVQTCLKVENCDTQQNSPYPTIFNQEPGLNDIENYASALYAPYLQQEEYNNNPSAYANWWDVSGTTDVSPLVNGHTTYYGFYSQVERLTPGLHEEMSVSGHDRNDGTGAWIDVDEKGDGVGSNDNHYGTEGTQVGPVNFPSVYGGMPANPEERRVQRVTVVNCEAAETYAAATGDSSTSYTDAYVAEVVDVVDLFMVTPPQPAACDPVVSNDPESNFLCPNKDITEVHLDVEVVDAASINSVNFDARFYAVLVH